MRLLRVMGFSGWGRMPREGQCRRGPRGGSATGMAGTGSLAACALLELPERVVNRLGVAGDLDLAPLGSDAAVGIDQEGAALDAEELAAVQRFLPDDVEGLAQGLVGVGDQVEAETLLRAEVGVRLHRILRHAEDLGAGAAEPGQQGVELQAFGGAAGGGILRVEV